MQASLTIARMLLGGVFLLSGVLKLVSPTQASEFLSQITLFDLSVSRVLVILFCCLEIAIAALLFIGNRFLVFAALTSSSLLLLFTFAGFASSDGNTSCGCFGEIIDSKVDEHFILRNFILFGLSMFILKGSTMLKTERKTWLT